MFGRDIHQLGIGVSFRAKGCLQASLCWVHLFALKNETLIVYLLFILVSFVFLNQSLK